MQRGKLREMVGEEQSLRFGLEKMEAKYVVDSYRPFGTALVVRCGGFGRDLS
jgi:hypothetical protein